MKLTEIVEQLKPIKIVGNADIDIKGINIDSRKIESGHLFVAMRGTQVDGHEFIPKAIEQERQPYYAKRYLRHQLAAMSHSW